MDVVYKYAIVSSLIFCVTSLVYMIFKTYSFGKKPLYAKSQGRVGKGIIYSFGRGMSPFEKESAQKHPITYILGVTYHIGIFLSITFLGLGLFKIKISPVIIITFRIFLLTGLFSGIFLLLKRIFSPVLRSISCPDDFISNALVDNFMLFSVLFSYSALFLPVLAITAVIMFLYIPLGKIRHCAFFFVIRILFGLFYGRRGVYPPQKKVRF